MKSIPELITIGHMCFDKTPDGFILGGAAAYAGICGRLLGKKVAIITSIENNFKFLDEFPDTDIHIVKTEKTTIFENIYQENGRQQYLLQKASNISVNDIPADWKKSPMVFIGPIANEIDPEVLDAFEHSLVCVNPQGWMRRWDEKGKVSNIVREDWSILNKADIVCMSLEDLGGDQEKIQEIANHSKILIITKGKTGATIYKAGKKHNYPAFKAMEVDPTGAGDLFAIAFLIRYKETLDIDIAANFANCAASISIEKTGTDGIPDRKSIEERLNHYLRN